MAVLLHGRDDPREAWDEPLRRALGWQYQVDYACDALNQIKDGGGVDDINGFNWGESAPGVGLDIDPATGLWGIDIAIAVPDLLLTAGADAYRIALEYLYDPDSAPAIFAATTRQLGDGTVQAIMLDQTTCGALPLRPATYNFFRDVRPPLAELPAGRTWRDCDLDVSAALERYDLSAAAMASNDGVPVLKHFRIVAETGDGDFAPDCSTR